MRTLFSPAAWETSAGRFSPPACEPYPGSPVVTGLDCAPTFTWPHEATANRVLSPDANRRVLWPASRRVSSYGNAILTLGLTSSRTASHRFCSPASVRREMRCSPPT